MKLSTDRILTTHVGSLPRPADLLELLRQEDQGKAVDAAALHACTTDAVKQVVNDQVAAGIDIICDGEMSKISYHVYARHRLAGLEATDGTGVPDRPLPQDFYDFPEMMEAAGSAGPELMKATVCAGPVSYDDHAPLERDIANLQAAAKDANPTDIFMNTVSPGCLSTYVPNRHYPSRDEYREALIEAMRPEYNAIHKAGFVVQLDCPDLAGARHTDYQALDEATFLADAEKSIEALNAATSDIPPEAMRMHICWLNYAGPHTHDIPIRKLLGLLAKARPQGILFEGANPRHAHEWEDLRDAGVPDDKVLIPGVIDSTSNFVEHPQLIAQRIGQYADIVGRERVIAGSDCGFGTYAGRKGVVPSVVRAKLKSMAEGAALASKRLW
ncbi:MAG: cobalamin-independent methionine synthase II family protein [Proteobacteria bacterium]|nr:cobalamin-independent methionine synthase II family protein [Pseudomonadota bacterium]